MLYQRVGILDVTREPRDKVEAQAMFETDEATMVDVPGGEKGLDKLVGLPYFSTKLSDFLVCAPKFSFQ